MNSNKSKQILIMIILAISFLIEFPLRMTVISILSFFQPLAYITSFVFYIALFACFLIVLKPNITSKSIIKSICVAVAFGIFEQIIPMFLFNAVLALAYEIIRPLLIFAVILWANYWILGSKIYINKVFLSIIGVLFVLVALFNILGYIQMIAAVQNMGNDFFSHISLLSLGNSVYNMLAEFSTYVFTFITLMFSQKKYFKLKQLKQPKSLGFPLTFFRLHHSLFIKIKMYFLMNTGCCYFAFML